MARSLERLTRLEDEAVFVLREVKACCERPVMLYSVGKDSSVLLHLARKAFFPASVPFSLLHIDTTWKFREMIRFRDACASRFDLQLHVHTNQDGLARGLNPFDSGSAAYTQVMKTDALRQALASLRCDAAIAGARRDEEKSRAKEHVFSVRSAAQVWEPRNQRPELWPLYNTRVRPGESVRVFPLSNWTELDVWEYIRAEDIEIVSLYLAAKRPVVRREGRWIMVDDDRMRLKAGESPEIRMVRFRTLGCYPLTAAIESAAATLDDVIDEIRTVNTSESHGRLLDLDPPGSLELKKSEG